jgi:hypothetical protein
MSNVIKPIMPSASEDFAAGTRPDSSSPTPTAASCPPEEELMAWLKRHKQEEDHTFSEHLQKCPRCAHFVELAAAHESGSGIDEGFEDQDLLAIQPGLRTPVLPGNDTPKASSSPKSKIATAKVPATTWELLTGRAERPRKS